MNTKQSKLFMYLMMMSAVTAAASVMALSFTNSLIVTAGIGLVTAVVLSAVLSSRLLSGIQQVESTLSQVNDNDLTLTVPQTSDPLVSDSLKTLEQLVKGMKASFKDQINASSQISEISDRLKEIVTHLNSAMEGISSSTEATSLSSEKQFAMLHTSQKEMERIVRALTEMAVDMEETYRYSTQTIRSTNESIQATAGILEIMTQMRALIGNIDERVEVLHSHSDEVNELNRLVNAVAEQTNLLALNASIEAARAGDHGRGFAIVASEISKLSSETNQASEKISRTIDTLKEGLLEIRTAVEDDRAYVDRGYETVEKLIQEFKAIQGDLEKSQNYIHGMNEAIQTVTEDGSAVSEQILEVTRFSEEITSRMEEAATQVMLQSNETENLSNLTDSLAVSADALLQFVADKVMRGKMLRDVRAVEVQLRGRTLGNEVLDELCKRVNVDVIYITDLNGAVEFCSERETIGLNLYDIDPSYSPLRQRKVDFITTPVKNRVEDGRLFKFLAIMGRDNRCYQVGLSVERIKNF